MDAATALDLCLQPTVTEWGSSRIAEFRNCPYGHHLRYVEGVSPRRDLISEESGKLDYFAVGNAVHSALAYVELGELHGFAADWKDLLTHAAYKGLWPQPELEEARRLIWPYFGTWGPANAGLGPGYKIVAIEKAWAVTLAAPSAGQAKYPTEYTGRADCVTVRVTNNPSARTSYNQPRGNAGHAHKNRKYVVWDHKTRSKNYGETDEELSLLLKSRPQFLGLAYLARENLKSIPDLMVNIIIKTKIPQFRRVLARFTDDDLNDWAVNHVASIAHRSMDERWKNYSSCVPEIGQKCWGFSWCHGSARDRQTLYSITRKPSYEPKERENENPRQSEKRRRPSARKTERERETEERRRQPVARKDGRDERRTSR